MSKVRIDLTFSCDVTADVELPEGKNWEDVEDFQIKWDVLKIKFKDSNVYREIELDSKPIGITDWKRPAAVEIYELGENGEVKF